MSGSERRNGRANRPVATVGHIDEAGRHHDSGSCRRRRPLGAAVGRVHPLLGVGVAPPAARGTGTRRGRAVRGRSNFRSVASIMSGRSSSRSWGAAPSSLRSTTRITARAHRSSSARPKRCRSKALRVVNRRDGQRHRDFEPSPDPLTRAVHRLRRGGAGSGRRSTLAQVLCHRLAGHPHRSSVAARRAPVADSERTPGRARSMKAVGHALITTASSALVTRRPNDCRHGSISSAPPRSCQARHSSSALGGDIQAADEAAVNRARGAVRRLAVPRVEGNRRLRC